MLKSFRLFTRKKSRPFVERKKSTFSRLSRKKGGTRHVSTTQKQLNCSPMVQRSKLDHSCYTPRILEIIKREYNRGHAEDPIHATDPTEIWKELKSRLDCRQEDCWLDEIKDEKLKKQIDRYIFAPDSPPSWEKNPNEWLSNYDILNVLEQYEHTYPEFEFLGPTSIDFDTVIHKRCVSAELCHFQLESYMEKGKTKIGIIFNLDKHTGPGTHWVSLFVDTVDRIMVYFDSNGEKIPEEISNLAKRIMVQAAEQNMELKFYENRVQHQNSNTECGMYSLFFIITMLVGRTHKRKHLSKQAKLDLFLKKRIPDKYVEQYRNVYFNG